MNLSKRWPAYLFLLTLTAAAFAAESTTSPATASTSPVIASGAKLEKLAGTYSFTEGACCDSDGNAYFTDQPNDAIYKWNADDGKISLFMKPAGRSNGTCVDAKGNLITCADEKNELWSIAPDKTVTVLLKDYNGKLLNGPNDIWIRPDGGMYITDPYYKRNYWKRGPIEQPGQYVFYLTPDRKTLTPVLTDLKQPNGIIGTPDGKTLYVSDIGNNKTFSYDIAADGTLINKKFFAAAGSDGMTIDNEGNVYATNHGVTVYDKTGQQIEHIPIAEGWTGNICFAGKDRQLLFITATKGVYTMRMRVHGVGSQ